eukprot:jgi/Ulvmu1/1973/UM012_0135.1
MAQAGDVDDILFQVPEELLCPITHAVFRNPVITSVGTVYEERAILQHLQRTTTDPLSNQKIDNAKLTPVFVLRSKAKQYATSTATKCLDLVLDPQCDDPAKYLRRACEVCDEAEVLDTVPQLPPNIVDFAQQHRGAMHDVFLLINFATALAVSGNTTDALALFANLIRLEPTRPVQTAVIKRCLTHCWAPPVAPAVPAAAQRVDSRGSSGGESAAAAAAAVAVAAAAAAAAAPAAPPQRCSVPAVLRFIRTQAGLRAADFVAILEDLGVPRKDLISICQGLLSSAHSDSESASCSHTATTNTPPPDRQPSGSGLSHGAADTPAQPGVHAAPGSTSIVGSRSASRDLGAKGRPTSGSEHTAAVGDEQVVSRSMPAAPASRAAQLRSPIRSWGGAATAGHAAEPAGTMAELRGACARLEEAMGVVPKLLALVEEDVRAEAAEKFAALEREIGLAAHDDADADSSAAAARGGGADADARRQGPRPWAVGAVVGGVLLPGVLGRLGMAAPMAAMLLKR